MIVLILIFSELKNKKLLKTVTKSNRGTRTERDLVLKILKSGIPAQAIFHDLYVKNYTGNFSQIDLVVITETGIIVFEVKDYSGWIFGTGYKPKWIKVLAYGKQKYYFYNPIMQNDKHIIDLKKQLKKFGNIPFYSVIVFYGDCVLKDINFIPNETFVIKSDRVLEVTKIIMTSNKAFSYTNQQELLRILNEAVKNGEDLKIQTQHSENIRNMLGQERVFD